MTTRVAVLGAAGRMGSAACAAIDADADLDLVARIGSSDSLENALDAGADVALELTRPDSVFRNTAWLLERGVHVVVGASGLAADDLRELGARVGPANCLVVPNFSLGAVLMMRFAAEAAVHLPDVEIIEAHHPAKADAPSGTALRTAEMIAEARARGAAGTHVAPEPPGPRGSPARGQMHADVAVHSLRLPGVVASQEVVFGGPAQTLRIRHDSIDRSSFMPGVLLAVKAVPDRPGLTVGLEHLLEEAAAGGVARARRTEDTTPLHCGAVATTSVCVRPTRRGISCPHPPRTRSPGTRTCGRRSPPTRNACWPAG